MLAALGAAIRSILGRQKREHSGALWGSSSLRRRLAGGSGVVSGWMFVSTA
jgi:hypothetical protein